MKGGADSPHPLGPPASGPSATDRRGEFPFGPGLAAASVLVAGVLAYANTLANPFVFLDLSAIVDNPTIRHLWPLGPVLHPPSAEGLTVGGRPLVNLSFALNYALGRLDVRGYHLLNLAIHGLAALTLWDLTRRTCRRVPALASAAERIAWAVALLWTVHPLQTESVTYVVQRAESLMGLFYLLTLDCFERWSALPPTRFRPDRGQTSSASGATRSTWPILSVLFCLCGMATKEVMVSAPAIVLLYDRTFVAGSWREAWSRRRWYYAALAATWVPLALLLASTGGNRGGTAGFGVGVPVAQYLPTQFPAVLHYLRLVIWPHPLNFYYPVHWVNWSSVIPAAAVLILAAGFSLAGAWRGAPWAFCAVWCLAILAPTSLVPGASQTMAEHRMYLALAPVLALILAVTAWVAERFKRFGSACKPDQAAKAWKASAARIPSRGTLQAFRVRVQARSSPESLEGFRYFRSGAQGALLLICASGLILLTRHRNQTYRSGLILWTDTAAKSPDNPYVQNNLAIAQAAAPDPIAAQASFRRALALKPDYPEAEANLGLSLAETGHAADALIHYQRALALKPRDPDALANCGTILAQMNRLKEASELYRRALAVRPGNAEVQFNLANILTQTGQWPEAIVHYRRAVEIRPDYAEALGNLGAVLANTGANAEAVADYRRALALTPRDADLHYNLALALQALGRSDEARRELAETDRLRAAQAKTKP